MDAVERQNAVFQRREKRVVYAIAVFCALLLLFSVCYSAKSNAAESPDYVIGVNVYICKKPVKNPLSGHVVSDCRASGQYTPHRVEAQVVDGNGRVSIAPIHATLLVRCGEKYCYTIEDRDGTRSGTMVGQSTPGQYLLEVGWYLSYDSTGAATAYREDSGPMHDQPPFEYNCMEYNECE